MERSAETKRIERDLRAIKALKNSDGWKIVESVLSEEMTLATRKIADPHLSKDQDIHFFRGALWEAMQLLSLPDKIIMSLENNLTLSATARPGDNE